MLNLTDFRDHASAIIDWIDQYFQNIESFPVRPSVGPKEVYKKIPAHAPEQGEQPEEILKDFQEHILPGLTHWQHPNFHAYFPANNSVESIYAEMITASLGAQCMVWETSPAAAELEQRMMEWLGGAMGIPDTFEGVIQDSASTATLTAILTAREVATGFRSNEEGVPSNLKVYCSTETHSSIEKGVRISGIGKRNLVKIEVDDQMRMIPATLEKQIEKDIADGNLPCCVIAAIGTTGTVAIDPLKPIADICERYKIWLHIDAAYAGSALLLPEYRWMIEGMEKADSFVFNPHKWLFTNFDCSAYFIKDPDSLIRTFEVLPEYLKTGTRGLVNDYRDWGIPLGRRFRALKLWFVLRSYGLEGLREKLRYHIHLNQYFAEQIAQQPDFELISPPFLNFTCFRFKPEKPIEPTEINQLNEKLLDLINQSGQLFMSHYRVGEKFVIRMVIGQTYVQRKHVDHALAVIRYEANRLLNASQSVSQDLS